MAQRRMIIGDHDKQRLFDAFAEGEEYVETVKVLDIKRTTASHRIVRQAQENNGHGKSRCGRRFVRMTPEMKDTLQEIEDQSPEFTLDIINTELRT